MDVNAMRSLLRKQASSLSNERVFVKSVSACERDGDGGKWQSDGIFIGCATLRKM